MAPSSQPPRRHAPRTVRRAGTALLPLLAALLGAAGAQAQTADPKELLRSAVANQLRPMLGDGAGPVVERLALVKPDGAISRNFDLARVTSALFGRNAVALAPDCRTTSTPAKEPDTGACIVESGSRDSPTGAYLQLAFSKNIGIGDLQFARRNAFAGDGSVLPAPVRLSDAQAYEAALKFLDLVGVPRSEIPVAPAGSKNPLPVRSLVAAAVDEKGGTAQSIALHKVVSIPRAFAVPGGLLKDPATGVVLGHVVAPGGAVLAVNDSGVQFARVDGWSDAQMDPKADPRRAKSTTELVNEITDDLWGEGVRQVGSLSVLIALRKAYPNPEDPNPPLCPVCGVLRPALQVIVSQRGIGVADSSEKAYAAPGLVREYDLVAQTEVERPAR